MQDNWVGIIKLITTSISPYYAVSLMVSVIAVIFSIWLTRPRKKEVLDSKVGKMDGIQDEDVHSSDSCSEEEVDEFTNNDSTEDENATSGSLDDLQARYKTAKHQAIVQHLSAKMTPEEIVEEKQTEKAQLEAIFNLLREQQEKFNVADMKDVEEQLSLYR